MANKYDRHTKKFSKTYEKIFHLIQNEVFKDAMILDIGTGTGEIPIKICQSVNKIEAIDYSEEMISIASEKAIKQGIKNIAFRIYDGSQLPYQDNLFDIIIMSNLLHVIPSPGDVLAEAFRVLKNNGKIILPTYLHNDSWKTRFISWILKRKGHPIYTRFSSMSLKELIVQNNFKLISQVYLKNIMPVSFIVATKSN